MSIKDGKRMKLLVWNGQVTEEECTQHSFSWSGDMPCTGLYKCIHCGFPHPTENRRLIIIGDPLNVPNRYEHYDYYGRQGLHVSSEVRRKTVGIP